MSIGRTVTVVDYGMGNLRSVAKALEFLGQEVVVTSQPALVERASCLILPGVGAFGKAMQNLNDRGLAGAILDYCAKGRPFLGICLGMQLLATTGEEGGLSPGLGLIPGTVKHLPGGSKIPQIGWNQVRFASAPIQDPKWFYFVHSYYFEASDVRDVAGWTDYGIEFASVVRRGNVTGTQFHPEKSSAAGLSLLRRFIAGEDL